MKYKIGDKVENERFGTGIIRFTDNSKLLKYAVEFDTEEYKLHDCGGHCKNRHGFWCTDNQEWHNTNEIIKSYSSIQSNLTELKKYIINQNATILFWEDGTKTIVKRMKKQKHNKELAFLTAYFQKHCGMSKSKANKYLESLKEVE